MPSLGRFMGTAAVGIEAEGKGWKLRDIRITVAREALPHSLLDDRCSEDVSIRDKMELKSSRAGAQCLSDCLATSVSLIPFAEAKKFEVGFGSASGQAAENMSARTRSSVYLRT